MISAIWHGFYANIYVNNVMFASLSELAKDIKKMLPVLNKYIPYTVGFGIAWLFIRLYTSLLMIAYFEITFESIVATYSSVDYVPFIISFGLLLILRVSGYPNKIARAERKRLEEKTKKEEETKESKK